MPEQISIIGLGQIGASIGMALAGQSDRFVRVGHDLELSIARAAERKGAIDRISINLSAAVEKAGIILLALPQDEIRATMQVIGPVLRSGALVLDTAPSKAAVMAVMAEFLPKTCLYVGLLPVIGPLYLDATAVGVEGAHANLFERSLVGIIAPPATPAAPIQVAADLIDLLKADKMFMEQAEADSLMAGLHTLPDLMAAALLNITTDRGGWHEGKKLAGRPFTLATAHLASGSPIALAQSALSSQEHTLRQLRSVIDALEEYASLVAANDPEALSQKLLAARASYQQWRKERDIGGWASEELAPPARVPSSNEWFGRLFGVQPRDRKRK